MPLQFESSLEDGDEKRKKVKQGKDDDGKAYLVDPPIAEISLLPVG
jgi:hypothetical protein